MSAACILVAIATLTLGATARIPKQSAIDQMAQSLDSLGQLSPIGVVQTAKGLVIIFGVTRYLAAKQLGWDQLEVRVYPETTSVAECMRMTFAENLVRSQMTFVEKFDWFHEYAKQRGLESNTKGLTQAAKELNYQGSDISKCLNMNQRITAKNKKRLIDAEVPASSVYEISKEELELQDELVERVISEKWSRKQLEQYFRQKKQGVTKFEFRRNGAKLILEVPKVSGKEKVAEIIRAFASELKRSEGFDLATTARRIREQCYVVQ